MRNPSKSADIVRFPARPSVSYPRRTLAPIPGNMTCLVLIKHGETAKALLVSDNGDQSRARWCPKSMLIIEPGDRGKFLVATMPKLIAEQRSFYPRPIDREAFTETQLRLLCEAESLAARNRNRLRNHQGSLPYPGRNAFA
jgi:hypothetical protein